MRGNGIPFDYAIGILFAFAALAVFAVGPRLTGPKFNLMHFFASDTEEVPVLTANAFGHPGVAPAQSTMLAKLEEKYEAASFELLSGHPADFPRRECDSSVALARQTDKLFEASRTSLYTVVRSGDQSEF